MSNRTSQSQRRARKATVRARSPSPTKKSLEYRQNGMARAHIYVDHMFDPPTNINALRCDIVESAYNNASELKGIPVELKEQVREIANDYLYHCQKLVRDAKDEAEWKSALFEGVFRRLVKLLARDTLATSASDMPWGTELKPRPQSLHNLLFFATSRLSPVADLSATALASFNLTSPSSPTKPSETTTVISDTRVVSLPEYSNSRNPLTTPKPDILVGLARPSFTEPVQHGLHFPFLLVEAKGLATNGNMMGAENQAAVGGACAINILSPVSHLPVSSSVSRLRDHFTNFSSIIMLMASII
ncbi:hypothetical protein BU25DRAFT_420789 [Macroventuria anomochaeta]|uniref:Uncharacterized protein n=1 Tax=Macroventuria anomochaeta TaxID=301207 RepID=A0ACB6S3X1_9PLEO|nr:uncharacterized protein BU25DRAFT_420789 [Macroventuria anomochaeta]KAF2628856.1 hypothetical protein BU25DRAFT_420789 [Macroventuria anomochaeta]